MSNYASTDVSVRFMGLNCLYDGITKQKEETTMLHTHTRRVNFWSEPYLNLPNAATRRDIAHKVLDTALIIASCAGVAAIMLFFTVISL